MFLKLLRPIAFYLVLLCVIEVLIFAVAYDSNGGNADGFYAGLIFTLCLNLLFINYIAVAGIVKINRLKNAKLESRNLSKDSNEFFTWHNGYFFFENSKDIHVIPQNYIDAVSFENHLSLHFQYPSARKPFRANEFIIANVPEEEAVKIMQWFEQKTSKTNYKILHYIANYGILTILILAMTLVVLGSLWDALTQ